METHSYGSRPQQKYPLYLTGTLVFLLFLTLGHGRPTDHTKSDDDVDSFFDSQRHSSLPHQRHVENGQNPSEKMIVRVIVTSSSSSSSSSTSSQESPDYSDATFTDFEFPVDSHPKKLPTTTENSPPSEKKDVEDIFSAFYKAFSQNGGAQSPLSDASHNVERFQVFYPSSGSTSREGDDHRREFGQRTSLLQGFGVSTSSPEPSPNPNDELTVVKAVSSSSSSSRGRHRSHSPTPEKWTPKPDQIVAVKTISTSSSISSRQDDPYQHHNPASNFQYHHQHNIPTTTNPPPTFRTTRRRPRPHHGHQYPQTQPEVQISVSSSTSSDEFVPNPQDSRPPHHQYSYTTPPPPTPTTTAPPTPKINHPQWQAQVWSQPAQVWGEPAKVWSEPAKVWGEPATVWGVPEQLWGHSPSTTTTTTTTTTPRPKTTRRPRYISRTPKTPQKFPKYAQRPYHDEDYPRDAEAVDVDSDAGSFVVLGDDDPETDSIDGSFDHHLGLPPLSPRPISLDQFKTFNFSYHHTFKNLNLSSLANQSESFSPRSSSNNNQSSLHISSEVADDTGVSPSDTDDSSGEGSETDEKMFGYVLEGSNVRRYRVEERTPDGYIVGEYGVLNNQNAFLRGVRYTADGTINPRLIHEALMKFLSLRR